MVVINIYWEPGSHLFWKNWRSLTCAYFKIVLIFNQIWDNVVCRVTLSKILSTVLRSYWFFFNSEFLRDFGGKFIKIRLETHLHLLVSSAKMILLSHCWLFEQWLWNQFAGKLELDEINAYFKYIAERFSICNSLSF